MREAREILARARALRAAGREAALATVVAVEGSAYRREGARLLIAPAAGTAAEGAPPEVELTGVLSGGCLERDLARPAARVAAGGGAELVVYDLLADEEAVWGFGLGCAGKITVLLEPLASSGGEAVLAALAGAIEERCEARLATVVAPPAGSAIALGDRVGLTLPVAGARPAPRREQLFATPAAGAPGWIDAARRELAALAPGAARSARLATPAGELGLLLESILPPVHLLVIGAERDVPPLLRLAAELGWEVTVFDPRPTAAAERRVAGLARYLGGPVAGIPQAVELTSRTAVLVATHRYLDDLEALAALAPERPGYLGLLGPGRRRERLLAELAGLGRAPESAALAALRGPAGLDLGGRSPAEVALAVVAEVQAVLVGLPAIPLAAEERATAVLTARGKGD